MRKFIFTFIFLIFFTSIQSVAKPPQKPPLPIRHHYHSSSSHHSIIVKTDYFSDKHNFKNCKEHLLLTDTIVNFYSDGRKRTYTKYTIKKVDGTVLEDHCYNVKHIIYDNNHYFLFKKGKNYYIMDGNGEIISNRKYTLLQEIAPNRILARVDKKYGVIDFYENIITPIKYKSYEKSAKNLFITNLNGYYGIMNSNNDIMVPNEYDKIEPIYEVYILKKQGKYALADNSGNIIFEAKYDKIKTLGEYILIKDNKKYGVLDANGKQLCEVKYDKIRLNRNQIEGKLKKSKWMPIKETTVVSGNYMKA